MKVHIFKTTEEAFKQSLYNNNINIGDMLIIPAEKVIGVCDIWPFSITHDHGWLEALETPESFKHKLITSTQLIEAYTLYVNAEKDEDGIHVKTAQLNQDNLS